MKAVRYALLAFALQIPVAASAATEGVSWVSQAPESTLAFSAWYDGEELTGTFTDFRVRVVVDEGRSGPATLEVEVRMRSADMNDREINTELSEAEWFDSSSFPVAAYTSKVIRPVSSGYLASGELRLKDSRQNLEIPLLWERTDGLARLSGSVVLSRRAWQVGTGEWADDTRLADRVEVRYEVTLAPER